MNMMPSQGQSLATLDKIRGIGSALSIGMSVVSKRLPFATYHHADTNAGSGMNDEVSSIVGEPVYGSPVVAVRAAEAAGLQRFNGLFCEIDAGRAKTLATRHLANRADCKVLCGDNAELLPVFARSIRDYGDNPKYAVGSIMVDPNGWFRRNKNQVGVPVTELIAFCAEFPRIDVVLNLNVRTYQLMAAEPEKYNAMPPREIMAALGKAHWLVSAPKSVGGDRFVLMIGRNFPTGDHKRIGLFRADSEQGRLALLVMEGKRQGQMDL